jgi:hypothetical protein
MDNKPKVQMGASALFGGYQGTSTAVTATPAPSHPPTSAVVPKIPFFSGDEPTQKGDVTYYEWRFEVKCLMPEYPPTVMIQAIRRSLRGRARHTVIALGEKASIEAILKRLDTAFGDMSTQGIIMQEFFNSFQRDEESVTTFGCRLETLLQTAIEAGHIREEDKDGLLRLKFWSSLRSELLKSHTRHKFDSITNYDELLREIRMVDKQLNLPKDAGPIPPKKVHHQPMAESGHERCKVERFQLKDPTNRD